MWTNIPAGQPVPYEIYRLAINQSNFTKAGSHQWSYNNFASSRGLDCLNLEFYQYVSCLSDFVLL